MVSNIIRKYAIWRNLYRYTLPLPSNISNHYPYGSLSHTRGFSNSSKEAEHSSIIDFDDTSIFFKSKSMTDLLRGLTVFSLCRLEFLVQNAESLMKISYKILGTTVTNKLLHLTFFGHFCAGENEVSIKPTITSLQQKRPHVAA
jgi:hypothetical protein